jgi:hypothetical protein
MAAGSGIRTGGADRTRAGAVAARKERSGIRDDVGVGTAMGLLVESSGGVSRFYRYSI